MVTATKAGPAADEAFQALLAKFDDGWKVEDSESWDDARDELDFIISTLQDAIDAAEEAREYAEREHEVEKVTKKTVGVGWECSGCGTGTLSRCLACDEATCGMCLISHECSLVEGN